MVCIKSFYVDFKLNDVTKMLSRWSTCYKKSIQECATEECARMHLFDRLESSYLALFLFKLSFFRMPFFFVNTPTI